MGHIPAHADISDHVIRQLQPIAGGANLVYLELGNFMTDISQFRDPYAFISAKQRFPLAVRIALSLTATSQVRRWADDLLGKAPDQRYAALAQFFLHISRFATHLFFAKDSWWSAHFLTMPNVQALTPEEVDRVFDWAFTQYYPHEHLDLPPFSEGPRHRQHPIYRPGPRGVILYLEVQLSFVAEELSKIEHEWVRNRSVPPKDPKICDVLVQLGHILHAVEDSYFHSNFVELWQWHRLQRLYPHLTPDKDSQHYNFLLENGLENTPYDNRSVLLRRRFARRLRYPMFTRGTEGHPEISEKATGFVYSGGFGGTDIFHTITGALEAIEEILNRIAIVEPDRVRRLRESDLVLVRLLFNENERHVLARSTGFRERMLKAHRQQVKSGEYRRRIRQKGQQGTFSDAAEAALLRAFEVDEKFMIRHPSRILGRELPGVGEFLIELLAEAQAEVEKSEKMVGILNGQPESIYHLGTANGASEETIGTHSLMSKDGAAKQPLRDEAVALAKFVSAAVAVLMVRRIQVDPNPERGYDWEAVIKHFVRLPPNSRGSHEALRSWEAEVLDTLATEGSLPTLDDIQDKPKLTKLTRGDFNNKLQKLRLGTTAQQLEKLYEQLERRVDG